ncbi:MAG: hypothetical protein K0B02_03370 [DPANN group archaeon]|nr:hypothetical protein [DPANN group archaeon]
MVTQRNPSDAELANIKYISLFNHSININKGALESLKNVDFNIYSDGVVGRLYTFIEEYESMFDLIKENESILNAKIAEKTISNRDVTELQKVLNDMENLKIAQISKIYGTIQAHELLYETFEKIDFMYKQNTVFMYKLSEECLDTIREEGPLSFPNIFEGTFGLENYISELGISSLIKNEMVITKKLTEHIQAKYGDTFSESIDALKDLNNLFDLKSVYMYKELEAIGLKTFANDMFISGVVSKDAYL